MNSEKSDCNDHSWNDSDESVIVSEDSPDPESNDTVPPSLDLPDDFPTTIPAVDLSSPPEHIPTEETVTIPASRAKREPEMDVGADEDKTGGAESAASDCAGGASEHSIIDCTGDDSADSTSSSSSD